MSRGERVADPYANRDTHLARAPEPLGQAGPPGPDVSNLCATPRTGNHDARSSRGSPEMRLSAATDACTGSIHSQERPFAPPHGPGWVRRGSR